ncbi:MAG: PIN-like domain-containing protein [Thermodesulfobacteriota bacterium]
MKSTFPWYFPAGDEEKKKTWDSAVLTVDANVLLDLYRYHENTRNSLLKCLESFKGRVWLSRQAAEEFFRNRSKVIVAASKGFKQAADELTKLRKAASTAVEQLQGNRIVPTEIVEELNTSISGALTKAESEIADAEARYPNFLEEDPILSALLEIFDGSVGKPFAEDELKAAKSEGDSRKKNSVPPGYMDDDKDGDRPYGDFFLWRQVLDHAKSIAQPMLFVTSERKEDWWEIHSGKTIGPRLELLREAHEYSGQRVLVYRTDRFLQFAAERSGKEVDASAVEEIRAIDYLRSSAQNAVRVASQNVTSATSTTNKGTLAIDLQRPLFKFTASGHFEPVMQSAPRLRVRLTECPDGVPRFRLTAGTGTNHDFNVHLKSEEYGMVLPTGTYLFDYVAESFPSEPSP